MDSAISHIDTDCIEQNIYNELETQYIAIKSKIIVLLKDEELWTESESNKTSCHDEYQLTDMSKISLPEFNGNQMDWKDFRDMFMYWYCSRMWTVLVHDDNTMPLVKKMHYLKGCFNGETARIMNRIPLSELKFINPHGHSFSNVLIIRNDDSKLICIASSRPSHSMKQRRRTSMSQWLASSNSSARWMDWKTLQIVFIYLPWKGDLMKRRRDVGRDACWHGDSQVSRLEEIFNKLDHFLGEWRHARKTYFRIQINQF